MVVSYRCLKNGCTLKGVAIPYLRVMRDGNRKPVCSKCGIRMKQAETVRSLRSNYRR